MLCYAACSATVVVRRETILRHEGLLATLALLAEEAAVAKQLARRALQQARPDSYRSGTNTQGLYTSECAAAIDA